jgi:tRNA1Val (adenine37-N6)-methyltransferase
VSEDLTTDGFLGGRLTVRQPKSGFRSGMDAVMLAAAVPARAGDLVLEFGSGAGVAALCLEARVPGACLSGIEIDPALAELAGANAAANGMRADFSAGRAEEAGPPQGYNHVFANPPFYLEGREDGSPVAARRSASLGTGALLASWAKAAQRVLKPKGTFTMILPADRLGDALQALGGGWGAIAIAPLWPKAGEPAKRILLRAVKGSRAALRLTPGLVLHGEDGPSAAADAILRHGSAFTF